MIFSPFSEVFGRRVVYSSTLAVATILVIPAALAPNIQILLIARALDGVAFSAPMTVIGGTLADLWRPQQRGVAMAAFNVAPFLGPVAGPLVGGYLSMGHGWRWLYWIQLILAGIAWILITFTVPETYAPTILAQRAAKLRHEDPESAYTIENDTTGTSYVQRMRLFLVRPFQLLFREPIVLCLSMYMSVLYGIMYMFFIAVSADS